MTYAPSFSLRSPLTLVSACLVAFALSIALLALLRLPVAHPANPTASKPVTTAPVAVANHEGGSAVGAGGTQYVEQVLGASVNARGGSTATTGSTGPTGGLDPRLIVIPAWLGLNAVAIAWLRSRRLSPIDDFRPINLISWR